MAIFEKYARYYDLFNEEKDYESECDFLDRIFREYANQPVRTVLDLGCGTGGHSIPLGMRGYQVAGIDISPGMLDIALDKATRSSVSVELQQGDIRTARLKRKFDVVISMYAVVVYMVTNSDLSAMFQTARGHLSSGGLFVFDSWYGPAVLTDRPRDSLRSIKQPDGVHIMRFVHPETNALEHRVTLNYTTIETQNGRVLDHTDEMHPLRFLFPQEAVYYMETNGFELVRMCPYPNLNGELTTEDWYMTVIARAVD